MSDIKETVESYARSAGYRAALLDTPDDETAPAAWRAGWAEGHDRMLRILGGNYDDVSDEED